MYVVTGATGHTGSIVAKTLLSRNKEVRVIGRNLARMHSFAAQGAQPVQASLDDAHALTKIFSGAEALYLLLPPDQASNDFRRDQDRISDALVSAVEKASVKYVVSLSSIGADRTAGTGPVVGLFNLERKLNQIGGLNVLHLRAGYFMENTLAQAGAIRSLGTAAGPLRPDLKLPMIATRDIGAFAAEKLLRLDFQGKQVQELQGQRDISMSEVASIIGKAIGKPDLSYVQLPDDQMRPALVQSGMSHNLADLLLEMSHALNAGQMRSLEPRSPQNTTPTSYETFVTEQFLPIYQQPSVAA
jgi:uncharacterized protein YbjT (DUF2867 family)